MSDNFKRCKYTVKSLIMLSAGLVVLDQMFFQMKLFNLSILLSLI